MKRVRVVRRDAFRLDLIEHYITIAREQPVAAERFTDAVDRVIAELSRHPRSGRRWRDADERLGHVRFRVLTRYKVLIFYVIHADRLVVLRALHGARGDIQLLLGDALDEPAQ